MTDTADATLAIFLSVLGSIASLIGLGIATAGIGAASVLEVSAADASKISSSGGILGEGESVPQIPIKPGSQPDIVPNTGSDSGSSGSSEVGSDAGGSDGVDEITEIPSTPLSGGNPPSNDGEGGDPTQTVIAKPTGVAPQFLDPGFIGNVGWTAPGTIITLANSIWQQVDKAQ